MKLPDEVTVRCLLCGAEHRVPVTYTEEIRDNSITVRIHAELTPEYTRHVARVHLAIDGLPQVLTKNGAEDAGAATGGLTGRVLDPTRPGGEISPGLYDARLKLSTTDARGRSDLILDGED